MSWKTDLNYGLAAFGVQIPDDVPLDRWASKLTGQPARNTAMVVAASSVIFFIAERDHNPKVNDLYDAMVYCSTCLSVGYGDIFAHTPVGKLLGSTLMTIGPSLAAQTLEGERGATAERVAEETLGVLREILAKLPAAATAL